MFILEHPSEAPIIKGVETSSDLTERKREDRPSVSPIRYSATDTKKEAAMHNGSLLIDMHVHLARYEVLSASMAQKSSGEALASHTA